MTVQTPAAAPAHQTGSSVPQFKQHLARSMMLALLTFAAIPVFIMGIAGYSRSRNLLREQVTNQLQSVAQNHVTHMNATMTTRAIRLDRIARRPAFLDIVEKIANVSHDNPSFPTYRQQLITEFDVVNRPDSKPLFEDFMLVKPDGVIYVASRSDWEGLSLAGSKDYREFTEGAHSIGIFDLAPILSNQFALLTIRPFGTAGGQPLGFLVGITESASAQNVLEELTSFDATASAYYVTKEGAYIGIDAYTNQLREFVPSAEQDQAVAAALPTEEVGSDEIFSPLLEFVNAEGVPVAAQAHWMPAIGAGMVLELPQEIAFGQLNNLVPFTITLFILTIIVMGLVIWVATNRVVKPVLSLADMARRFSEGDWQMRSTVKRDDELGLLAYSFNHMADELSTLYRSLEFQVEERTEQIRTAAEVAQSIVSTFDLDELLNKTVSLIVERFGYYHTGIFMVDRAGKMATLRAAYGPAAEQMLARGHKLAVGSPSIIGWVTANNQPRVASDVADDPVYFKNELLPKTRAEVGIPISSGNLVLGALDVQSTRSEAFDPETIIVLQTLANQIATAIQNVSLIESTQVNLQELERLYRSSRQIAQAQTEDEVLEVTGRVLKDAPFVSAVFTVHEDGLELVSLSDPDGETAPLDSFRRINVSPSEIAGQLASGLAIIDLDAPTALPRALTRIPRQMNCQTIALLPVTREGELYALVMLGAHQKTQLSAPVTQPYASMVEMVAATLDKVKASETTERRLTELEAISSASQAISTASNLPTLYSALHEQIRQTMGDFSFVLALYDMSSDTIRIPYMYEDGQISSLDPFPLGEGLSSILIRTRQPLMLVEDTERRAVALGAKIVGRPAKSWLGVPLQVGGEVIGALIVQDLEHERSFDENDLRFITALAGQVAGAIYNARLLDESRQRTVQLQTAAEIARDISGSLHLDELLSNAVTLIRERFDFYHASVFLIDPLGEYAIVREATGEAGAQMKRTGHKLGVGSKSIVGYVSGRGEPLVVNDTNKDVTYYANPLLPETRAEAAIPLKVGERILGVIDVQSTHPYAFSDENLQTLQILADQLAVAVVNTELFAETQEHLSQHRLLHHITTSAASGTTLEEALDSAVQGLQVTLGGDRVAILMVNKEREGLEVRAAVGYSEEDVNKIHIPIGTGVTGWAAAHQKTLRIDNTADDPRYIQVSANTRSELAIPLVFRNELLGVLNVESEQVAAYDEHDEEMLGTLGGSLAAIIANARLLEQVRRQAERERMLYEVTSKIRRSTDIQTILATTANELSKAIGARRAHIKVALDEGDGKIPDGESTSKSQQKDVNKHG
ncbi:MAG: GAF domain-containing protein [Chloroflexi bacterium]|nr:GAF domain-containing protein [Chloroflexota bacterium]